MTGMTPSVPSKIAHDTHCSRISVWNRLIKWSTVVPCRRVLSCCLKDLQERYSLWVISGGKTVNSSFTRRIFGNLLVVDFNLKKDRGRIFNTFSLRVEEDIIFTCSSHLPIKHRFNKPNSCENLFPTNQRQRRSSPTRRQRKLPPPTHNFGYNIINLKCFPILFVTSLCGLNKTSVQQM